jgi:hypothetical protein
MTDSTSNKVIRIRFDSFRPGAGSFTAGTGTEKVDLDSFSAGVETESVPFGSPKTKRDAFL